MPSIQYKLKLYINVAIQAMFCSHTRAFGLCRYVGICIIHSAGSVLLFLLCSTSSVFLFCVSKSGNQTLCRNQLREHTTTTTTTEKQQIFDHSKSAPAPFFFVPIPRIVHQQQHKNDEL